MKHIIELYHNTVKIKFDDRSHVYTHLDTDRVIANPSSVHKLLNKPFLVGWAARKAGEYLAENMEPWKEYSEVEIVKLVREAQQAHEEYSAERMEIGSKVHAWIEGHIRYRMGERAKKEMPKKTMPEIRNGILAFLEFEERYDPVYHYAERVVYSRTNDHIGTCDAILEIDDKIWVADWKTGSGLYLEHAYQTASYSAAITEEFPLRYHYPERLVVRLSTKTGKPVPYWEEDIQKRLTGHDVQRDYAQYVRLVQSWYELMDGPQAWSFKA